MIPLISFQRLSMYGYPCTSGDDPSLSEFIEFSKQLSLHKRGWSFKEVALSKIVKVIPAQAGMIPVVLAPVITSTSYPCTSGDDPITSYNSLSFFPLSLHKRGWSYLLNLFYTWLIVIPAQAGMILNWSFIIKSIISYPCTSGDDPARKIKSRIIGMLSLHKRGWSSSNL